MSISIAYWINAPYGFIDVFGNVSFNVIKKKSINVDSEASSFISSFPSQDANVQSPYMPCEAH